MTAHPDNASASYETPALRRHLPYCGLVIAAAFALLWRSLVGGKVFLPTDLLLLMPPWKFYASRFPDFHIVANPLLDVIQQYVPWRIYFAHSIHGGALPLWNPYMYCGTSFVANGQSAIFYPLNYLFVLLPVKYAFGWLAFIHLCIAGVATYAFAYQLSGSRWGSVAAAVTFMYCGFNVAWMEYTTFLSSGVWLPVALALFEWSRRYRVSWGLILSGVPLGLSFLGGHFQVSFYVCLGYAAYVAFCIVEAARNQRQSARDLAFPAVTGIVIGLAIGAVQILPCFELAAFSTRSGSFDAERIRSMALPLRHLVTLLVPYFYGSQTDYQHPYWGYFNFVETTGYAGALALPLGVLALVRRPQSRTWLFGGWVVIGLLIGMASPIYFLFVRLIPGFAQFAAAARILYLVDFGAAILVAYAIASLAPDTEWIAAAAGGKKARSQPADETAESRTHWALLLVPVLGTAAILAAVWATQSIFLSDTYFRYGGQQISWWLLCVAVAWSLIAARGVPAMRRILPAALVVIVFVDLFRFAYGYNPATDAAMVYFPTAGTDWVRNHLDHGRVLAIGTDAIKHWTPSNTLMAMGIPEVQGSDSLWSRQYAQFLQTLQPGAPFHGWSNYRSPALAMLGVRYVLTDAELPTDRHFQLIDRPDTGIYANQAALPRAHLAAAVTPVPDSEAALRVVTSPDFNPADVVLTGRHPPALTRHPGTVAFVRDGRNRVDLTVNAAKRNLLFLGDSYYPGWRAAVNGHPEFIVRANFIFRGVEVPAGRSTASFVFVPTCVTFGLFLTLLATLIAAAVATSGCVLGEGVRYGRK